MIEASSDAGQPVVGCLLFRQIINIQNNFHGLDFFEELGHLYF